jgi:small subunit ribosomal protein S1
MAKERIKAIQFKIFDSNIISASEKSELVNLDDADLKSLYDKKSESYKVNCIVSGSILEKTDDGIKVDINYKSNGLIPIYEFNPIELKDFKIGDKIEVMIEELENADGAIVLSYEKAKSTRAWEKIAQLYKNNKPVEGVVTNKVPGGLCVDIGITVFLPGSQIDTQRVIDFDQWVGKRIQAYIIKMMPKRGNVVISRRKYMHEQKSEVRKGIIDTLTEGQTISGVVKNITKYGAFIDIGGVDGLLHITDMTWSRIEDPTEIIKIGETITVKVLTFDRVNEKISLGMKQLSENPWNDLAESINIGSTIKGKIISIKDYGVFIEVMRGVEGLVHISEISWTDRINDLNKHYKVGQEIEAMVVSLERKNRRMSLSIKQLEKNPWDAVLEKYQIGQTITGKVTNIADFGFFVQIAAGVDGLVHVSDISWTQHIKHPSDIYNKSDIIEAKIIDINHAKKKISLSIKELKENPWKDIAEKLPVGSMITGKVIKIAEFGAFVRLQNSEIEAFIHSSECSDNSNTPHDTVLSVGSEYTFKVLRVSPEEQKIGLSLRKNSEDKRHNSHKNFSDFNNKSNSEKTYRKEKDFQKNEDNSQKENRDDNGSNYYKKNNNSNKSKVSPRNNNSKGFSQSVTSSSDVKKKSALQLEVERLMKQQLNKTDEK